MSHEITFDREKQLIKMRFHGDLTLKAIKEVVAELAQVVKETNCSSLLNDFRDANVKLSTADVYDLPKIMQDIYAASGISIFSLKRAAVLVRDLRDARFFETVSANRGHSVKVFSDIEEASKWLLAGNAT